MVSAVLDLVSAPGVLYATVLVLLTVDAFIPVVPAQALMIGGGVLSASGHVQLALLVLAGAGGVVAGDMLAFLLGRQLARRDSTGTRLGAPRKTRAITRRLTETMRKHIFLAVLFCRFVPAGRMITAVYAGRNGVSTRRFATYDVVAATLWASYGALLGHFGGQAIASSSWLPLALVGAAALLFVAGAPLLGLAANLRKRAATAQAATASITQAATAAIAQTVTASAAIAQTVTASAAITQAATVSGAISQTATAPAMAAAVAGQEAGKPARLAAALVPAARSASRICRRRTAVETLAAVEPMAAIEVLVAAEAVAAAESVVVQVNGLHSTAT
jgi:membrane protein DedA with SNARE-associated domain